MLEEDNSLNSLVMELALTIFQQGVRDLEYIVCFNTSWCYF